MIQRFGKIYESGVKLTSSKPQNRMPMRLDLFKDWSVPIHHSGTSLIVKVFEKSNWTSESWLVSRNSTARHLANFDNYISKVI